MKGNDHLFLYLTKEILFSPPPMSNKYTKRRLKKTLYVKMTVKSPERRNQMLWNHSMAVLLDQWKWVSTMDDASKLSGTILLGANTCSIITKIHWHMSGNVCLECVHNTSRNLQITHNIISRHNQTEATGEKKGQDELNQKCHELCFCDVSIQIIFWTCGYPEIPFHHYLHCPFQMCISRGSPMYTSNETRLVSRLMTVLGD